MVGDSADPQGGQKGIARGPLLGRLQAQAVDSIKRHAIARLHRSPSGEALLLELYLWAEEAAGSGAFADLTDLDCPPWLRAVLERHTSEEDRHAVLLRERLAKIGAVPRRPRVGPLSRWKLARLRQVAKRSASSFRAGLCVPYLTLAWRMEVMGVRVLARHVAVLGSETQESATRQMLETILRDERGHVCSCEASLKRLVAEEEREALTSLAERIDAADRRFGIVGALALLASAYVPALAGPRLVQGERP